MLCDVLADLAPVAARPSAALSQLFADDDNEADGRATATTLLFVCGFFPESLCNGLLAEDWETIVDWSSAGSLLGLLSSEPSTLLSAVVPEACRVEVPAIAGESRGAEGLEADELASAAPPTAPSHLVFGLVSALPDVAGKLRCSDLSVGQSLDASEVASASQCPVIRHRSDGECITESSVSNELGCGMTPDLDDKESVAEPGVVSELDCLTSALSDEHSLLESRDCDGPLSPDLSGGNSRDPLGLAVAD